MLYTRTLYTALSAEAPATLASTSPARPPVSRVGQWRPMDHLRPIRRPEPDARLIRRQARLPSERAGRRAADGASAPLRPTKTGRVMSNGNCGGDRGSAPAAHSTDPRAGGRPSRSSRWRGTPAGRHGGPAPPPAGNLTRPPPPPRAALPAGDAWVRGRRPADQLRLWKRPKSRRSGDPRNAAGGCQLFMRILAASWEFNAARGNYRPRRRGARSLGAQPTEATAGRSHATTKQGMPPRMPNIAAESSLSAAERGKD